MTIEMNEKEKPTCDRKSCLNNREGYCTIKNPERDGDFCLHYEETLESLHLKANVLKGALGR